MTRTRIRERIVAWLSSHPQISRSRAKYACAQAWERQSEQGILTWGEVLKALGDGVEDPKAWFLDRLLRGHEDCDANDCVRRGDVEGAVRAYRGRRAQRAEEQQPRGPFPITDVQSSWLKGLLQPMPEPRAWDFWTLQRIA